ncbi:flavonoid O-methyltransferase-like protein Os11g0303600 isoform X1 [Oryza sativa Japonica Group]|uniref:flavonoid O-methyltransferase-like protein Os11g0303600 isoform X1 n=1 Tax=Oryza sativa subsp. japonica TaxID=39947 RepID=UPI00339BE6A3
MHALAFLCSLRIWIIFCCSRRRSVDAHLRLYPTEGFVNFLQQNCLPQPQEGENFHLVGQTTNTMSTPPPTPQAAANNTVQIDIHEDAINDASAKKRSLRYWTHDEEERLASAWLNASKDPIHGNEKKGDTFWKEVTDEFNRKGNGKRTREINQLKVHWSRLKSSIGEFNDYWTKVTQMNTSGYDDDMLEKEAQQMYANTFGKPFALVHWWKILRKEPKWCAMIEKDKNKAEVVDIPDEQKRPIGREAAQAERNGKRKKDSMSEGIVILGDNIEKIIKVTQDRKLEREKVTEAQIHISNVNLKAAEQQKEAKMFEVYNSLLTQDTSNMSEEQKARRDKALQKLEEKLFAD